MDLSLFRKRKALGIVCTFFCIVLSLALLDGLFARFRQPPHEFHVLPGSEIPVMGPLPQDIGSLELLKITTIPESGIGFSFTGTQSGYWLGGTYWRATVEIPKNISAGKYIITVEAPSPYDKKPLARFTIFIHDSPEAIRSASLSLFKRYLGVNPWVVFLGTLAIVFYLGIRLFILSSRIERLLKQEGMGEIYRVFINGESRETYALFSIGKNEKIIDKDLLEVIDLKGNIVGTVKVKELFERDGIGLFLECKINPVPGLLVRKKS